MPSAELPVMVEESKDQQLNDSNSVKNESLADVISPSDCDEKPANGSGDCTTEDGDDDSRKLFVGGLSWETTESDLNEYFSRWGKVTKCIIKLDRYTRSSRGFGFVTMESEECVNKVLNVSEHWLKNKKIDPKKAKPSREPLKKIFVGGIDPDVSEDQIREHFSTFGKVESLDLPYDTQKGKRKHYIFVSFSTEAAARKAISTERQEIFGRQCDVRAAVTREQANKQKALKNWYLFDSSYAYPNYAFDYAGAYPGFDPFGYNYYGYDFFGGAAAAAASNYGAYAGLPCNQFRNLINSNKINQGLLNSTGASTGNNNRLIGSGGAPVSLSSHHAQQNQPHSHSNFANLLGAQLDSHHPPLSSGLDFSITNPHTGQKMVIGSVGAGFSHPQ